jgi:hypothetical protein
VAFTLGNLGNTLRASGDETAAVCLLARAVTIYDRHGGEQPDEAEARFPLVQALAATRGSKSRARQLAVQAHESMASSRRG